MRDLVVAVDLFVWRLGFLTKVSDVIRLEGFSLRFSVFGGGRGDVGAVFVFVDRFVLGILWERGFRFWSFLVLVVFFCGRRVWTDGRLVGS